MFEEKELLNENASIEEVFTNGASVSSLRYQTETSLRKYFTRDKLKALVKFITEMPEEDATKER